jgi:hypothetical protein
VSGQDLTPSRPLQRHSVKTLALDLEGTLISNVISQVPRPGLFAFLEWCRSRFPDLLIYSGVRERKCRLVAARLIADGFAPRWFGDLRHQYWDGDYKDLRRIEGAELKTTAIVDDRENCIEPSQIRCWIRIEAFDRPYSAGDSELERVAGILDGLAALTGGVNGRKER